MLSWFRKRVITIVNKDELIFILTRIVEILSDNAFPEQANAVRRPLQYLYKDDTINFIKNLNTVDIWGGSGAAWEVYLQPKETEREFMQCVIDLIEKLEQTGIEINGIRGILKAFKNELSKNT